MENSYPYVSIIFPSKNGKVDTIACLESISDLTYPKNRIEIIIVDVSSTDGSQDIISSKFELMKLEKFSELKLIKLTVDKGAPNCYNIGINSSSAESKYILKIDNDIIFDKNCLKKLINKIEQDKRIGIVGTKNYYYDYPEKIWSEGHSINYWTGRITNSMRLDDCDTLSGCCFLIRKEVIEKIGLMEEDYFIYFDDTDYCVRAKKAGFKILVDPEAVIWHKVSMTTNKIKGNSLYYMTRNRFIFFRKYCRLDQYFVTILFYFLTFFPFTLLQITKQKDPSLYKRYVSGLIEGLFY